MDITVDAIAPKEVFRIAAALVEKMKTTTEPLGRSHQPVIYSFPVFGFSQTHPVFEVLEKIKQHKAKGEVGHERTLQLDFYHTSFFSCNEDESVIEEPPIERKSTERFDWNRFYNTRKIYVDNVLQVKKYPEFYADSPFIFLVVENNTGLIFQIGVVKDPSIDTAE